MPELSGFAELTFSPDDEDVTGRGWYAQTINTDGSPADESDLFETRAEALSWARDHGATKLLSSSD